MKKNRNILLVIVVLAVVAGILAITQSGRTFKREQSDFAVEDTSAVTRIFMSDKNNNMVILSRLPSGEWMVDEKYPASRFNIRMLLGTIHDLEVKEPVSQAAHNSVIRELSVNSVKVEIYQRVYRIDLFRSIRLFPHEKLTKVYYVGGATMNNRGSYMLIEGSPVPFVTWIPGFRGFVSPRYSPMVNTWRDYNIFRKEITAIASVQVEIPGKVNESWLVVNRNATVSLFAYPEKKPIPLFDTLAVLNFLAGFRNLNFEAIISGMDPVRKDSILSSTPSAIITLTDTSGGSATIRTFLKEGAGATDLNGNPLPYDIDRLYVLVNDGRDFALAQYYTFDRILRPRSFFLKE